MAPKQSTRSSSKPTAKSRTSPLSTRKNRTQASRSRSKEVALAEVAERAWSLLLKDLPPLEKWVDAATGYVQNSVRSRFGAERNLWLKKRATQWFLRVEQTKLGWVIGFLPLSAA